MSKTEKPRFFYGYVIVASTYLLMIITWGTYYTFGIFFKPVLTEFGWTRAMTSGAFAFGSILTGSLAIIAGRLNDKLGPRLVMTACGFFLSLGYLLMSQIGGIWQFYLFYGVMIGIGMSGSFTPLVSTVTRWFVKGRGLMTGLVTSGISVGEVIMPPAAAWLIFAYGWRNSYIVVGIIVLATVIASAQFLKRDPGKMGMVPYGQDEVKAEGSDLQSSGFSLQEAIHLKQFWLIMVMLFCYGWIIFSIMVHIAPHATDLGLSPTTAASIISIIGGVGIVGRLAMGFAADKIGSKIAFTIAFILTSIALLWLLTAKEVWMFYLFAVIFSFGYAGMAFLGAPLIAELFGLRSHGIISGISSFTMSIGGAIGPVLVGHIFDLTGSYQLGFLTCAGAGIIGAILTSLIRPTHWRDLKGDI